MQFKRVLPISDHPAASKKLSYQNRTPASIQQQHVQAFKDSGVRQVEFCEQHNIPYKTFTNWLRRYRLDQPLKNQISRTQENIVIATAEDHMKKIASLTTIQCTLPNGLSLTLNPIILADLSKLIEVLSTCKLN